jgi:DNA invertase Pin-like site-specific DNA recombinase
MATSSVPLRLAYSYIRFSSAAQAEGNSRRRQIDLRDAYCQKKGLVLDNSLHLEDLGVSAFRGTNVREGALAGFLEACRVGRVKRGSVLIVESLDRLSRDQIRPALQLFLSILDYGVTIVTLQPEREYTPENPDSLALIEPLIIFSRAHEESSTKSDRVRDSWDERRKLAKDAPMTGRCPAWLRLTGEGFVEIKPAADAVRRMFELCIEGVGVQRITKMLSEEGFQPFGRSSRWNMSYVRKVLTFPAVFGEMQPHVFRDRKRVAVGEPIPNYFPAVVSETDFYRAQQMIKGRRKKGGRAGKSDANLFTGLVFHAVDKTPMQLHRPTGNAQKYLYLRSGAYLHGKESPGGRSFPYLPFETAVLAFLKELQPKDVMDPAVHEGRSAREEEIAKLSQGLLALNQKLDRVNARARETEDFDTYLDLIKGLNDDKKAKSQRLEQLQAELAVDRAEALCDTQSLVDLLARAEGNQLDTLRRRIKGRIRTLVQAIWVLVEKVGRHRVGLVQVFLHSGVSRTVRVVHPLPKPDEHWPGIRADLEDVDLRTYSPSRVSTNLGA